MSTEDKKIIVASEEGGEQKEETTPWPVKRKAIAIYVLIASSAISQTLIEPILPFMVAERMGIPHDSQYSSLIVGIISSALFFGECISMAPIGYLSDIYGRKWFIVLLQVASFLGVAVFGLIRVWWLAALVRFLQGCAGGIHATSKATLTDISSEHNRSLLLAYIATTYAIARAFSSLVGVSLLSLLRKMYSGNPYMLAGFMASGVCLVGIVISLFLGETNKKTMILKKRVQGMRCGYGRAFFSGLEALFLHRTLSIVTLLFCMSYFSNSASITLWAIISGGAIAEYGMGFSVLGTGIYIGVFGLTCAIFQLIIYKPAMKKLGLYTMFLIASLCATVDMTMFSLAPFPYWLNHFNKTWWTTLFVVCILCCNALLASASRTILIPALNGMIGNLSDLNNQGLVQGSIQTLGNLSKAFGPIVAGTVYGIGQRIKFPWLMPLIISTLYLIGFGLAFLLLDRSKVQQKNPTAILKVESSEELSTEQDIELANETHTYASNDEASQQSLTEDDPIKHQRMDANK